MYPISCFLEREAEAEGAGEVCLEAEEGTIPIVGREEGEFERFGIMKAQRD